jgi:type I site-specific restriction endonuclease
MIARTIESIMPLSEADTCRKYVIPKLYAAGWTDDQIAEQKTFTDGRIVIAGSRPRTRTPAGIPVTTAGGQICHFQN